MTIHLSPWQTKVIDDSHRFKVINCGRRAGKSYLSAIKLIDFASKNPKTILWYVAPTYKQAKLIMWTMLLEVIPLWSIVKTNDTELLVTLTNGSSIHLKGAEDPDKLRGTKIDFAIFDEVAFIKRWDEVWKVMRPTLVDSKASVWFISTPNGFNHFKKLSDSTDPDYQYFHFTSYDNPYLDRDELEKTRLEMTEDAFAQEFLGEFRKMTGLIYKEFDRNKHMVDVPLLDSNYTYTRSLDFGFGHKTALIYFAISPHGNAIYGFDGFYKEGMTEREIADIVKLKDQGKAIVHPVADSAQPMSIAQLYREYGVKFDPVDKAPDSVKDGITKVAEMLKVRNDTGKPTLMFSKHLTWIADEFESYRWVENKSADNAIKEVPYKVNDDAMDAIRYFAMIYKKPQPQQRPPPNYKPADSVIGI